tara:strand:- start:3445 stop:4923 length:1479 start_codon:yes stop_codon:yes gene_type:complete
MWWMRSGSSAEVAAALHIREIKPWAQLHHSELALACGPMDAVHTTDGVPAQGLHVIRLYSDPTASGGAAANASDAFEGVTKTAYTFVDGVTTKSPPMMDVPQPRTSMTDWFQSLRTTVELQRPALHKRLQEDSLLSSFVAGELKSGELKTEAAQWRAYSPYGTPLKKPEDFTHALHECGTVYVFEGGSFMWPGVQVGYNRTLQDTSGWEVRLTTMSLQPLAFTLEGLLSDAECDAVVSDAEAHNAVGQSLKIGKENWSNPARTSSFGLLPVVNGQPTEHVRRMERRAHQFIQKPMNSGEALQINRYWPGERFSSHADFFEPARYVRDNHPDVEVNKMLRRKRNRLLTMIWYLNDTPGGGGETHFMNANGGLERNLQEIAQRKLTIRPNGPGAVGFSPFELGKDSSLNGLDLQCQNVSDSWGLKVRPVRGNALLFYSLRPDGAIDLFSEHAGCPPEVETKWAATKWVWTHRCSKSQWNKFPWGSVGSESEKNQ